MCDTDRARERARVGEWERERRRGRERLQERERAKRRGRERRRARAREGEGEREKERESPDTYACVQTSTCNLTQGEIVLELSAHYSAPIAALVQVHLLTPASSTIVSLQTCRASTFFAELEIFKCRSNNEKSKQ